MSPMSSPQRKVSQKFVVLLVLLLPLLYRSFHLHKILIRSDIDFTSREEASNLPHRSESAFRQYHDNNNSSFPEQLHDHLPTSRTNTEEPTHASDGSKRIGDTTMNRLVSSSRRYGNTSSSSYRHTSSHLPTTNRLAEKRPDDGGTKITASPENRSVSSPERDVTSNSNNGSSFSEQYHDSPTAKETVEPTHTDYGGMRSAAIDAKNSTMLRFPLNISTATGKPNQSILTTTELYDIFQNRSTMERFHYKHAPILLVGNNQTTTTTTATMATITLHTPILIRIVAFGAGRKMAFRKGPTGNVSDEVLNIAMDGFSKSPYFQLISNEPGLIDTRELLLPEVELHPTMPANTTTAVTNTTPIICWVIDMRRMQEGSSFSIPEQTVELVKTTLTANPHLYDNLKIIFLDYRDRVYSLCRRKRGRAVRELIDLLGSQNVRIVTQQVVGGTIKRKWDADQNFVLQGEVIEHNFPCFDYPALHAPYTVRSEYADAVQRDDVELLPTSADQKKNATTTTKDTSTRSLLSSPCDTERPIDVAHFWTVTEKDNHRNLRDGVNKVLQELNTTSGGRHDHSRRLNITAHAVSEGGRTGRTELQSAYVQALLECKIIVVAQRDSWEDHYRFFEAIIGGALVLTDPMVSLPEGYENGTNIVIYESFDQLRDLILYYLDHPAERLKIARRGWELAMREHRTYHWMEKLFFGKILTK